MIDPFGRQLRELRTKLMLASDRPEECSICQGDICKVCFGCYCTPCDCPPDISAPVE